MPIAFNTALADGPYTKSFSFTALDDDQGTEVAIGFVANGMTVLDAVPVEVVVTLTSSAADVPTYFTAPIAGILSTGVTIRCVAGGGAGGAVGEGDGASGESVAGEG